MRPPSTASHYYHTGVVSQEPPVPSQLPVDVSYADVPPPTLLVVLRFAAAAAARLFLTRRTIAPVATAAKAPPRAGSIAAIGKARDASGMTSWWRREGCASMTATCAARV